MRKKLIAVLDVGSSKITAVAGERGVNKTFLIKARKEFAYDGFSEREFFDTEELKRTLISCAHYIKNAVGEETDTVYVGVPGAFTDVTVKDSQLSFPKKKKITEKDTDNLFDSAFVLSSAKKILDETGACGVMAARGAMFDPLLLCDLTGTLRPKMADVASFLITDRKNRVEKLASSITLCILSSVMSI